MPNGWMSEEECLGRIEAHKKVAYAEGKAAGYGQYVKTNARWHEAIGEFELAVVEAIDALQDALTDYRDQQSKESSLNLEQARQEAEAKE